METIKSAPTNHKPGEKSRIGKFDTATPAEKNLLIMNQNDFILQEKASRDTIDVKRAYIMMAGDIAAGVLLSQIIYWHLPDKGGNPTKLTVKQASFKITEQSLENLKSEGVPDDVLERLENIKNQEFIGEAKFARILKETIGNETTVRSLKHAVKPNNYLWLAKKREDWWDEVCMLPKQFDRAIKELENRQLVKTELLRFDGSPVKHIRLNWDVFLSVYNAMISDDKPSFDPKGGKWIFPDREYGNSLIGNMETPEQGISSTPRKPMPAVAPISPDGVGTNLAFSEITTEITTEDPADFSKAKNQDIKKKFLSYRKRLSGKQLRAFEQVADNLDKVVGKTLIEFVTQSPDAVISAYKETLQRGNNHFSYFSKVFFSHITQKTKGLKHENVNYSIADSELLS